MQDNKLKKFLLLRPMSVVDVLNVDQVDLIAHGSFLWTIVDKLQYLSFTIPYLAFAKSEVTWTEFLSKS